MNRQQKKWQLLCWGGKGQLHDWQVISVSRCQEPLVASLVVRLGAPSSVLVLSSDALCS